MGITVNFIFQFVFFLAFLQDLDIYLFYRFLLILLCALPGWQSPLFGRFSFLFFFFFFFFFLLLLLTITVSDRLAEFVYQTPREVCTFHSKDGFQVVHIPLVRMVIFKFLAQFPMDHFPFPIMLYSFVLICCIRLLYDWMFPLYHHIGCIYNFLCVIYFCFKVVCPYGVVLCCY